MIAAPACTRTITSERAVTPARERTSTTRIMAIARERLLLAAYIALTCASPDEDSAATEKPALVSALAIVTNAQIQKSRRFPGLLIVFMLPHRYSEFAIADQRLAVKQLSRRPLLCRYQIELAERLLIKECPFLTISAAPVSMTTRNAEEIARPDAFGTGIIPVEIRTAYDDKQYVRRMRVHPRVESGTELRKPAERSLGGIAPRDIARDPRHQRGVFDGPGTCENDAGTLILVCDHDRRRQRRSDGDCSERPHALHLTPRLMVGCG